jgi:hypothetical protein
MADCTLVDQLVEGSEGVYWIVRIRRPVNVVYVDRIDVEAI